MKNERNRMNAQIYEQASNWFVECRTGELDAQSRRQFAAWLRSSPEHMRAYLELAAIWNEGPNLDPRRELEGLDLNGAGRGDNVVPLVPRESTQRAESRSLRVAAHWRAVAASFVMATVLGVAGYLYSQRNTYATGIGEQRTFTLPDGSTIQLNALSEIRVDYREAERGITLKHGQALFKVAHDAQRPFIVTADRARVRALGTQFDVNLRLNATTVTVVEGRVAVGVNFLSAGQQATVTEHETRRSATPNVEAVTAWTQQRLVFESTPLEDVAVEFNRYNTRQLVIRDSQLARLRITGAFSSADPGSILRFLRARPGIRVNDDGHQIIVSAENFSAR